MANNISRGQERGEKEENNKNILSFKERKLSIW